MVGAADILSLAYPYPQVVVPAYRLGLVSPSDELDALSNDHAWVPPNDPFAILFSVDRQTFGLVPPDPLLKTLGVPFNVLDQAERGQAAGDEYLALQLFTRAAGASRDGGRLANNVLVRNNYDEGGTDFGAMPYVDAYGNPAPNPMRYLQDNVDAACWFPPGPPGHPVQNVYFSLSFNSPSLIPLSGPYLPSGATLFFNADPLNYTPTHIFATSEQLGLTPPDDIDAALVFDTNVNGSFDGSDRVIFSLKADSPLNTIPGASLQGAAGDLFVAAPGQPPQLLVPAMALGLGYPTDNIDALDLVFCSDSVGCASQYGIQALKGDLNCDGTVGFGDINPFVLSLTNPGQYEVVYSGCFIENGDINRDGSVNFGDINPFVALLTGSAR
jgi:hypothetical protein